MELLLARTTFRVNDCIKDIANSYNFLLKNANLVIKTAND